MHRNSAGSPFPRFPSESEDSDEEGDVNKQDAVVRRVETKEKLTIFLDVPGYSSNEIDASVENGNELVVKGNRTNRIGDSFCIMEQFILDPTVFMLDGVMAHLSEGVLEVTIPKNPDSQPRQIAIGTGPRGETETEVTEAN